MSSPAGWAPATGDREGFRSALREAAAEGAVKRLRSGEYAPAQSSGEGSPPQLAGH